MCNKICKHSIYIWYMIDVGGFMIKDTWYMVDDCKFCHLFYPFVAQEKSSNNWLVQQIREFINSFQTSRSHSQRGGKTKIKPASFYKPNESFSTEPWEVCQDESRNATARCEMSTQAPSGQTLKSKTVQKTRGSVRSGKDKANNLREPQHTPGAYPKPQTPKWKEFRNINCWLGVWGMLQGSVGKFWSKQGSTRSVFLRVTNAAGWKLDEANSDLQRLGNTKRARFLLNVYVKLKGANGQFRFLLNSLTAHSQRKPARYHLQWTSCCVLHHKELCRCECCLTTLTCCWRRDSAD